MVEDVEVTEGYQIAKGGLWNSVVCQQISPQSKGLFLSSSIFLSLGWPDALVKEVSFDEARHSGPAFLFSRCILDLSGCSRNKKIDKSHPPPKKASA